VIRNVFSYALRHGGVCYSCKILTETKMCLQIFVKVRLKSPLSIEAGRWVKGLCCISYFLCECVSLTKNTSLFSMISFFYSAILGARAGVVVKALRDKPTGRGFDSRWCQWNFLVI
jgi:hypothetical protein